MRSRTPIKIYFKTFATLVYSNLFVEDCVSCDFQKELESNKQFREASSERQDQHKAKIKETILRQLQLLRKKLLRSFIVILSAIIFGFLCITVLSKITIKDMLSTNHIFILLSMVSFSWATLGRLGWEGQTAAGDTVIEELDKFIFRFLYWLGALFAVFAIMPRNTSIEAVVESIMTADNQKDWIDILSALLTPTIAISAIVVAAVQCRINRKRLKNEYFDRRIAVYEAIKDYIGHVWTNGDIEKDAEMKYYCNVKNVFFLFGSDIEEYVNEIFKKCTELHALKKTENEFPDGSLKLKNNMEKQSVIKNWFGEEVKSGLQERFKKYLSLSL